MELVIMTETLRYSSGAKFENVQDLEAGVESVETVERACVDAEGVNKSACKKGCSYKRSARTVMEGRVGEVNEG